MDEKDKSLFELVGGRPVLQKVHKIFYEKVFAHPCLMPFFEGTDREVIENQQTDFTASQMGEDTIFSGKTPHSCHQHMFITRKHLDLRNNILRESCREFGLADGLAKRWLDLGQAHEKKIVKSSMDECKTRYKKEKILTAPMP